MSTYASLVGDVESQGHYGGKVDNSYNFAEAEVRRGFISKVLGLVTTQLILTTAITALFVFCHPVNNFVSGHPWVLWTSLGVSFGSLLALACVENLRRLHPWNLIFLFTFTACEGVLVGSISSTVNSQALLLAVAATAVTTLGLTLFALQTKVDFTLSTGLLFTLLFALISFSILQIFIHAKWLHLGIAFAGSLLFSCYLVVDIQMVMGTHALAISPDEYIFAALNIYLDILNLFLYLLSIFSEFQSNQ